MTANMMIPATCGGRADVNSAVGSVRRMAARLLIAALTATLMLGAMADLASARTVTTTLGQNDFTRACRDGGGTPKRIRSHVVQCTTADGTVVTCDFNTSPATCTVPFMPNGGGPLGQVTDAELEPVDAQPSGPGVRPGQVGTIGDGVLVQVDAAPASPAAPTTPLTIETAAPIVVEEAAPPAEPSSPESSAPVVVDAEQVDLVAVEDERP